MASPDPFPDSESNPTLSSAIGEAHNYTNWVLNEAQNTLSDTVLEVGLGEGNFFGKLAEDRRYVGIDNHAPTVNRLLSQYPNRDYRLIDVTDPDLPVLIPERFTSIVCCNVLEHVEDDVAFLANLGKIAQSSTQLFLFVPAFPRLFTDLDRLAGHHRRYTKRSATSVVERSGWIVRDLYFFNPIGALTWYLQGLTRTTSLESESLSNRIRFFDRYLVPPSRSLNRFTQNTFGQSLIVKCTWPD